MASPKPIRIHQIVKLKPQHYEAYKKSHQEVWPEVVAQIKDRNIEDYSISYDADSGILFASFKYTGHDLETDMARYRESEKMREWWRMTDEYQVSLNKGAISSEKANVDGIPGWWKNLEEVFYLA